MSLPNLKIFSFLSYNSSQNAGSIRVEGAKNEMQEASPGADILSCEELVNPI
jgi:hypothetical protein